ncbi:cysteine desulfurase [Halobacillus sp. A1]|uniref:cysteine desulfurase family protein n=1 Tax=Halobacillus sp. A1 TaxID=2880262 RepID=UPI0020A6C558|nr:cysteine desulfurase family protein [Halobacillus sp. A1]MCP3033525.1 cysteine desulfurase [Halobacillus sp. A1]
MIYFDNSATTKPFEEVMTAYQKAATQFFANPSSLHYLGSDAERLLMRTRQAVAEQLRIETEEVIFTSGGTESNNLAIKGIAFQHQTRGKHLITSSVEHPSVLEVFKELEQNGFEVSYASVDHSGKVDPEEIKSLIRKDTILISIMSVNNELGTIQPLEEIGDIAGMYPKVLFHADHVQGIGKVPLSLKKAKVDLCSISGHKIHGLKGTGILYVRKGVLLSPLFHGGGHEANRRSGTENLPGMVAFAKALRMIKEKEKKQLNELIHLRHHLINQLNVMEQVIVNSPLSGAPHIINVSVPGIKPEVMIHALAKKNIFVSAKSACSSKQPDVSSVLKACNLKESVTKSAIRISLSYSNTIEEADLFLKEFNSAIRYLEKGR